MKYLNHITLNTGHIQKTYPGEVNKQLYLKLQRIYKESLNGEAEVLDGYTAKSTSTDNGTLITLFRDDAPILTTAISSNDDGMIWEMIHNSAASPLYTKLSDPLPIPYIADRLEVGVVLHMDALQWTGDFSRCMGWIILAPEEIR
ncbi:hypothetical protein [Ferviditalea candida]|uniref:Uncharacterized protein n=1 Tax=Ferviditalea candida TaxID=3108399 RepID=A0ABU5ZMK6_9BACL|nr:hypothetical protein [Paenibacillaceae bacterium T2]